MPVISARALLAGFRGAGLDADALRIAAGLDASDLERLDGAVPATVFPALWQAAFRQAPRAELPTEVGLAIPFGAFGALDYLAGTAPTVEAAFRSLQDHFRQVAALSLEIAPAAGGGEVRLVNRAAFPGQEVSDEMTVAILVARFRDDATGRAIASGIRLTRPVPSHPTRHAALLGAPVTFGCSVAGLTIPAAAWKAPMPGADPALQETLSHLTRRLDLDAPDDDVERALRAKLRVLLPGGQGDAATLARALGMSERTLHRRLQAAGRTFRAVLDAFREAEAEQLLASGAVPLSEVAIRLGFSDQSAWNRAFRRWKGMSPSEWVRSRSDPGTPSPRR